MFRLIRCLTVVAFVACGMSYAHAETLTFDFNSGLGTDFTTFSVDDLFTIDDDGPDVRISKPVDDGTLGPGSATGGIRSQFLLVGDFTATVDFDAHTFPFPGDPDQANSFEMRVVSEDDE